MPVTIRKACALFKIGRWDPWPHKPSGIVEMPGSDLPRGAELRLGGLVFMGGRHLAGKLSVPRYYPDDEFFPVLEFSAHRLARAWKNDDRSSSEIAQQLGIGQHLVIEERGSPKFAVPILIETFRFIPVKQRTLDEYHHRFRKSHGFTEDSKEERSYLEADIRSFLKAYPAPR